MHKRVGKSFIDILILTELKNAFMSGYDTIAFVHSKFIILVSSGMVYSFLFSLERDELIKGMCSKRKRVYELTEKREKTIKILLNPNDRIKGPITSLFLTQ